MGVAVGTAWLLYNYRIAGWINPWGGLPKDPNRRDEAESLLHGGHKRMSVSTSRPPSTWFEALATISETLRFTYSETLGKWPIGDLAFGINYLLRRQVRHCFDQIVRRQKPLDWFISYNIASHAQILSIEFELRTHADVNKYCFQL